METKYRLEVFRSITITGPGRFVIANIGPSRPGERWEINKYSVTTTGTFSAGLFQVFRGNSQDAQYQIDVTQSIAGDISSVDETVQSGEFLSVMWSNVTTQNATGTFRIEGSYYVPGRRAY